MRWVKELYQQRLGSLEELFGVSKPIIGMVHLLPLPGSPGCVHGMEEIIARALEDARALAEGGVDGIIVENMWDLPYYAGDRIPVETLAAQTLVAREVVKAVELPVGVNVIHNGGRATLSIALASGAKFIRACAYTGALVWDTGELDRGVAADLLRLRKRLGAGQIKIFADVCKKHAVMFPGIDLETHATWTEFHLADALVVTGPMTGAPASLEDVKRVKLQAPGRPVLVGSGTTPSNVGRFLEHADGAIVGTALKKDGVIQNPVDVERVRSYMDAVKRLRP